MTDADDETDGLAVGWPGRRGGSGPSRAWYLAAVGLLVLGVAAGVGSLLLAVRSHGHAAGVIGGLVAALGCPVVAFGVAAVICLLVALRRHAARRAGLAGDPVETDPVDADPVEPDPADLADPVETDPAVVGGGAGEGDGGAGGEGGAMGSAGEERGGLDRDGG